MLPRPAAAEASAAVTAVADPEPVVFVAGVVAEESVELDVEFGMIVVVVVAETHLAVTRAAVEVAADDLRLQWKQLQQPLQRRLRQDKEAYLLSALNTGVDLLSQDSGHATPG